MHTQQVRHQRLSQREIDSRRDGFIANGDFAIPETHRDVRFAATWKMEICPRGKIWGTAK